MSDAARRISNYTPFFTLRGVRLARAPVDACVSSAFGPRSGGAGQVHEGLDLYTGSPRPVAAAGAGRITRLGEARGYGLSIDIDHGHGVTTRYAHLSGLSGWAREDTRVEMGEIIARTGKSGNATAVHLHFEVLIDGRPVDPLSAGD